MRNAVAGLCQAPSMASQAGTVPCIVGQEWVCAVAGCATASLSVSPSANSAYKQTQSGLHATPAWSLLTDDMPALPLWLQEQLSSPELEQEVALLGKLLYKNTNQHRGAPYFCHLLEVRAWELNTGAALTMKLPNNCAHLVSTQPTLLMAPLSLRPFCTHLLHVQVRRLVELLRELALPQVVASLHQALDGALQQPSAQPPDTYIAQLG